MMVLIADDEKYYRALLARLLDRGGHQVVATTNGAEAVMELQRLPVDVVVMDIMMPVLDGIEATEYIRALPAPYCKTPIVGVSASHNGDDCLAAGMNAYLPKPVDLNALIWLIEKLAEHAKRDTSAPSMTV